MPFDGGVLTIPAAISLINILFHVFKRISKWLKRRANTLWKEDHRMLKIVKDYFARNSNSNANLPNYIQALVEQLKARRRLQWMEAPEAAAAQREAERTERYQDSGYTTDFEASDVGSGTDDDEGSNSDKDEEEDDHTDDDSEDDDSEDDDEDDDDEDDDDEDDDNDDDDGDGDSDNYAGSYDSDDSDDSYGSDDS